MSPASRAVRPESNPPGATTAGRVADLGLIAAFLCLTFLLGVFPLKDTDFWWHLKAGDLIRQTGQVPTVDTFTYGAEGRPWIDLHWGFQVALSWGYAHGGVVGLNLAKCAITCLAVVLLITSRRPNWPVWAMLLAWLPALLVLSGRMYIRPETISLLYLSIVLAILFRWERKPWLAFALPLVQVCWVNTQGLFLLEPIVIGCALIGAAARPGAFAPDRRGWWRTILTATALTGVACLFNPYGLAGALYPIQLARTMSSQIFKDTIGELKPLLVFVEEVGLDSLPLQLHLLTVIVGGLSFLVPWVWSLWAGFADRRAQPEPSPDQPKGRKRRESSKARKQLDAERLETLDSWRPSLFRALLFVAFSALSLAATRNSHQFAAVVGTVTAWNFGEWAAALRARKLRRDPTIPAHRVWPRLVTFAAIGLTFAVVASGRFYAWAGEGRTIGLGEEPLWFPRDAVKFAGGPGMPDRMAGFHNGHPALYEYYFAPEKKTYTDARLEVMGPEIYRQYTELSERISQNTGGWAEELDRMGRPAVLVDNLDERNAPLSATLLSSRHWRCVWFDPIASVFVHDSLAKVVQAHGVNFAARHFARLADTSTEDPATLAATARALRLIGTQCVYRAGNAEGGRAMFLLGLDYARKLREVAPKSLDGWKQAGLIESLRDIIPSEEPIPRFRLSFDPVFDLSPVRATYLLSRALEIAPEDGYIQSFLAKNYQFRGMDEEALPLLERFIEQPNRNLSQQKEKSRAADEVARLRVKLGKTPSTKWANLGELDRVVAELLTSGRPSTAADVMESAYRTEARPWEWADRLAVLRLHLGQPSKARAIWLAASTGTPLATRSARVAATYLVEGDFDAARKSFREAIAADPNLFEARYGLAHPGAGFRPRPRGPRRGPARREGRRQRPLPRRRPADRRHGGALCEDGAGLAMTVERLPMNFLHYVYLAVRRSEPAPQSVVGIIRQVGEEIGVRSEADRDKLPTHEDLSDCLRALIEAGRIVEVSPHRYREATYGSSDRNFSGVSLAIYEKACEAFFRRLSGGPTRGWKRDVAEWPGPDRARWGIGDDLVSPGPAGRHACVLYSCAEIRIGWTVGLLALLKGPAERPEVILRPANFTCYVEGRNCVQWLDGGRYCVVIPYLFNSAENRIELLAYTFLDLVEERFSHYEMTDILYFIGQRFVEKEGHFVMHALTPRRRSNEVRIDPEQLEWRSWRLLTGTTESPPPDLSGARPFIETPY